MSRTAGGTTTTFLYDEYDVVVDRGSDSASVDYINGAEIDEKLRLADSTTSSAGPLYFLTDQVGSSAAFSDSSGNAAGRLQYAAFGENTGSALTRYGFTGREGDSATGLIYYRARWYDPQTGRFAVEDPLGPAGGLNLYTYVLNDPVGYSDPLGLQKAAPAPVRPPVPPPAPPQPPIPPPVVRPPIGIAGRAGLAGVAFLGGWIIGRGIGHIPIGKGKTVDDAVQDWMIDNVWGRPDPGPAWPPRPNPNSAPDPTTCEQPADRRGKSTWTCIARGHVNNFRNLPNAPAMVEVIGTGPDRESAAKAALYACSQAAPRGTYVRHYHIIRCWRN